MARRAENTKLLTEYYNALFAHYGAQHWWPAKTRFEVIVGAILTQNTNWGNVKRAIGALKKEKTLTTASMYALPDATLAELIRPSGYFNVKAKRLKNFLEHLYSVHNGSLNALFSAKNSTQLRSELLTINGIGPETADSILLYAGHKPEFVIDAYTKRILERHNIIREGNGYEELKRLFTSSLAPDTELFNEYHALIVRTGSEYCSKKRPKCAKCPLKPFLSKETQAQWSN